MKIIFVGGGTSGHVNPAINLALYIKKKDPDAEILYIGAKNGIEETLVRDVGLKFTSIKISGFNRKFNLKSAWKNLITLARVFISSYESKKIINKFKPEICVGTGGYVCGPVLRSAYKLKIPFVIHEQNAIPGLTTRLLASKASKIIISINSARNFLNKFESNIVNIGNPLQERKVLTRPQALDIINKKYKKKFDNTSKIILSFGGSLGAGKINEVMFEFMSETNDYCFVHGFGRNNPDFLSNFYKKNMDPNAENLILLKYIYDIYVFMIVADLVICRSGSMSISELAILGKPTILIPSPNVTDNHQYYNALALKNADAASMIEEEKLNFNNLKKNVDHIINNKNIIKKYSKNIRKFASADSTKKIYDLIKNILKYNKKK
ncbi:MAG: undecaprenyldiphospho-muramoylpentapeptide beta-N-acetylglucosaminyltransferase [Candidatus Improbicoccus devescovinae]|nr:MAG: undecaprenyldiphospho-muramoylpentapeptide beta-N-acetylglucosaminyltransferase [Candidatus Improbicoccus devescovinae]